MSSSNIEPSQAPTSNNNNTTEQQQSRKQLYQATLTSEMGPDSTTQEKNIDAFYRVLWPVLETEGGWTLVKGSGPQEGLTIFCPPGVDTNTLDLSQISKRILGQNDNNDKGDDDEEEAKKSTSKNNNNNTTVVSSSVPELVHQQGPWNCVCGVTNEEGTLRCETCFGWREVSEVHVTTNNKNSSTSKKKEEQSKYYTKIHHVISHVLKQSQEEEGVEFKAASAYEAEVPNARELFSTTSSSSSSEEEEEDVPLSPTARMTRQRFTDIAWKDNRTHYEKSSSRVGSEYQVDVLPVVGSHCIPEEEVLYDQVWNLEKAQKSGKIDFIDHRVKSSIKEPAYTILHNRNYQLPGFFAEVSKSATPTDCSHWTAEERAKFRKLVFEKHEDMWQISEELGRPVRECVTYYLGKFKTSKDFRSLRRVMEKARDENAFKYPGEILCDKCGKGGKLVWCEACDGHYHLNCQDPPLKEVPEGNDWRCNKCMQSKGGGEEEEDTSNGDEEEEGVEMDTSNAEEGVAAEEEEEVSSFEGKKSDVNDDAELTSTGKSQDEPSDTSVEVDEEKKKSKEEATAQAKDASSGSSVGTGEGKRPISAENATDDTPQHQAKKSKSATNFEEDASMTSSFVSNEVGGGVDSEMAPPPAPEQPKQQQEGSANAKSS